MARPLTAMEDDGRGHGQGAEAHRRMAQEEIQSIQEARQRIEASTQALCTALRNLGIDARALERSPFLEDEEEESGWIEIAENPVRWMRIKTEPVSLGIRSAGRTGYSCWIPDSRVGLDYPMVRMEAPSFRTISSTHVGGG